jgi:hypothetical protein
MSGWKSNTTTPTRKEFTMFKTLRAVLVAAAVASCTLFSSSTANAGMTSTPDSDLPAEEQAEKLCGDPEILQHADLAAVSGDTAYAGNAAGVALAVVVIAVIVWICAAAGGHRSGSCDSTSTSRYVAPNPTVYGTPRFSGGESIKLPKPHEKLNDLHKSLKALGK